MALILWITFESTVIKAILKNQRVEILLKKGGYSVENTQYFYLPIYYTGLIGFLQ